MSDGRRERGAATRERLLAAARELFGERGFEGTSIEAVLERSGVARGALYHHFAGKAELFDAVLEAVNAELAADAAAQARGGEDPLESLRNGARAWLGMALDPAVQRIVLIDPPAVVGWRRWRELDERYWLGGLHADLRRLAREGRVPAEQAEMLAQMLYAALNEASLAIANAEDQEKARAAAQGAIEGVLLRVCAGCD
ncbi:MAG TPA: helix-turn-helix domain-containing protein [Solirubrobacteraceae bacterium]|nr:helix-turn-helix domain-containing protein [Solirubrobacteraceae bacterium]